jgi:heme/copper-type cytochrome/quinol oxidase subunit 2
MNQPLAETIFWIAAAACALAELAILRFSFATRGANKSELVPPSSHRSEIVWAVVPALALILVFGATWKRIEARENHMRMMDHSGMQMPSTSSR